MTMAMARISEEVTEAGDCETSASKPAGPPSYVPTLPIGSRLVFPGPKMRVQTRIVWRDRHYALRGIFAIEFREVDGGIVLATHRQLPVHGHGSSQEEAIEAFCEAFDLQWRSLVEVDETSLTSGGRDRRRAMQAAAERVTIGEPLKGR